MKTRLATSLIALSTALAAPAMADVTAADVWSNQQNYFGAMGVNLGGQLSGDMLTNPEINIVLPQGIASFQIKTDAFSMVENRNGTVTISYPSPMSMTVAGGASNEGSFSAELMLTHDGYTVVASGNPGDVTYVTDGQNMRFEVVNVEIEGDPGIEDFSVEGFLNMSSWTGTTQITEGNLITFVTDSEIGETVADYTFMVDNVTSQSTQTTAPVKTAGTLSLPAGGIDIMNLSGALRDGLAADIQSTGEGSNSTARTTLDGSVINSQATSTGPQVVSLRFGEDGLAVAAEASDFAMTFLDQMIFPGELDFAMGQMTATYDIPLNASEEEQDFRIATSLKGVTMGDTVWNLFDPSGQLPRDPAEISYDVTGVGTNGTDLLNFAAMAEMFGPPAIEIDEVTIENLYISAVGAEATATGAMTFDWTDFQTIPGIARPEGKVTVNLNGANALMDRLVAMGLIPEDQLMMPRMMMGMFATPVGDDMLETVLEVNSEGHVLANGQRLQ